MGITPLTLEILQKHIGLVGGFNGCRMLELGNQQMYCHVGITEASPAKIWFEGKGVNHTSIDLNGQMGALALDLSKSLNREEWKNSFDVVTDFGTSEHVGDEFKKNNRHDLESLYQCRANCHAWCRPGGLMLFNNPKTGHWPLHGYHFFTISHYEKLAIACNYRVAQLWEHPTLGNFIDGWQTYAVLVKQNDSPFLSMDEYIELCRGTVYPI
jgi:hypothetical protein